MNRILTFSLVAVVACCFAAVDSEAKRSRQWQFPATPYFWMAGYDGDITLAGAPRPIDLEFSDAFDDFSWGLTAHVEAQRLAWAYIFDVSYKQFKPSDGDDLADIKLWLFEGAAAYQFMNIYDWLEVLGGVRVFAIDVEQKQSGIPVGSGSQSWADPFAGARVTWNITREWALFARADIGGFGIGSDISGSLVTGVGYTVENISFVGGVKAWYADYETGSGADGFAWKVLSVGPGLGITFHL